MTSVRLCCVFLDMTQVVDLPSTVKVEVYPVEIFLCLHSDMENVLTAQFSRVDSISKRFSSCRFRECETRHCITDGRLLSPGAHCCNRSGSDRCDPEDDAEAVRGPGERRDAAVDEELRDELREASQRPDQRAGLLPQLRHGTAPLYRCCVYVLFYDLCSFCFTTVASFSRYFIFVAFFCGCE